MVFEILELIHFERKKEFIQVLKYKKKIISLKFHETWHLKDIV